MELRHVVDFLFDKCRCQIIRRKDERLMLRWNAFTPPGLYESKSGGTHFTSISTEVELA